MCAVWLKLLTVLCLSCTALGDPGSSGVVWRELGGAVTIQCRSTEKGEEYLALRKGLGKEHQVLFRDGNSQKNNIDEDFEGRLQLNGVFPTMDILIRNLTSDDTGPYWCVYKKFDSATLKKIDIDGSGSVLLVVTDRAPQCDPANNSLILVSVVICAVVLFFITICFFIWIIRKTKTCTTKKPRRVAGNDVYEDMRGTIRR